ncbi:MAG: hypothetical protein P4M09_18410 [Devosia sp.]|nr:hypothetical protein [Devosia sp.]
MYPPTDEIWPLTRHSIEARVYAAQHRGAGNWRPLPARPSTGRKTNSLRSLTITIGIIAMDATLLMVSLLNGGLK